MGAYLSVCHAQEILHKITSVKEYGTEFSSAKSELESFEGTLRTVLTGGPPQAHYLAAQRWVVPRRAAPVDGL